MMASRGGDARPLPKRTREAPAACEAVGLTFWSDHPRPRCMWAVDEHQRAHVVRVNNGGRAQHVCGRVVPVHDELCAGDDEAVSYATPD